MQQTCCRLKSVARIELVWDLAGDAIAPDGAVLAIRSKLGRCHMLIMAKSGGGKTFMAQLLLLMLGRTGVEISILERGDSYRPLVELMGGRVIEVNLDGNETLNPWDMPEGGKTPSKEKIAFLKNLTGT